MTFIINIVASEVGVSCVKINKLTTKIIIVFDLQIVYPNKAILYSNVLFDKEVFNA